MKGFIRQAVLGTSLGAALASVGGCVPEYRELVDPCWPDRYNYQARHAVRDTFNAQAANGHALDQTVWNQHFEVGSDKLIKAGEEHLKYLARRHPAPDPHVFVQTSWDAKGDRTGLDQKRIQAVQTYLASVMLNHPGTVVFDVCVVDFAEPGMPARPAPSLYVRPASVTEALRTRQEGQSSTTTTVDASGRMTGATTTTGGTTAVAPR
jgi:YD repeat-containing protein